MSDKEANSSGQRPKAVSRMKKKKQKSRSLVAPEAREIASETGEKEGQLPSSAALQESGLTSPESALQASAPEETPTDKAVLDANLGNHTGEESVLTGTASKEERVGLEKIPQDEARLESEGKQVAQGSGIGQGKEPNDEVPEEALISEKPVSAVAESHPEEVPPPRATQAASTSSFSKRTNRPLQGSAAGGLPPEQSVSSTGNGYGKLRLWLRAMVIGLIMVAIGNAYYARTLASREREARQALAEKLTEQLTARVETQVDSQLEARLPGREDSFQEAIARLAQENKKHAEEAEEVQEKIAALETTLGVLRTEAQMGPEAEDWDIAEVAYLLRIANERLQLERDVKTTLVALQAADQILRKAADPALTPVRSQLAEEINALKALPTPDISGMALSLSNLIERVRDLEFKEVEIEETTAVAETQTSDEAPEEDDMATRARRFLNLIWDDLKHLVMVRRRGKGDEGLPILPPEERYFLYRNLELELEAARLSLLRNDEEGFRQSLHLAQDWLQSYFQGADAEFMQGTIVELAQADIRPSLPNISGSLKTLNRVWIRTRSQTTGGS